MIFQQQLNIKKRVVNIEEGVFAAPMVRIIKFVHPLVRIDLRAIINFFLDFELTKIHKHFDKEWEEACPLEVIV